MHFKVFNYFLYEFLKVSRNLSSILGELEKTERKKNFDLSKLQIFINKSFTTSLNDAVNNSSWQLYSEAKERSRIKSECETTGQDVYRSFQKVRETSYQSFN